MDSSLILAQIYSSVISSGRRISTALSSSRTWWGVLVVCCAAVWIPVYLFLPRELGVLLSEDGGTPPPSIHQQPDELATYSFARHYALTGEFGYYEPLSVLSLQQVHPRSTTMNGGRVVPIGFPGFAAVLGAIGRSGVLLFGEGAVHIALYIVTPLCAFIGLLSVYRLLREWGSREMALFVMMMSSLFPAWWYYASRPFSVVIPFLSFLLLALALATIAKRSSRTTYISVAHWSSAALACSIALLFRPNEAVWVVPVFICLSLIFRVRTSVVQLSSVVVGLLVGSILFFSIQYAFYGQAFGVGYIPPTTTEQSASLFSGDRNVFRMIFFPFGVDMASVLRQGWHYLVQLFHPWIILPLGWVIFLGVREQWWRTISPMLWNTPVIRSRFLLLLLFGAVSVYLLVYYGSWNFFDNLSARTSIGSSQVRYFSPIFFGYSIIVSLLLIRGWVHSTRIGSRLCVVLTVYILYSASFQSVYPSFEGLFHIRDVTRIHAEIQRQVYEQTSVDAVIVTRYADKYLFPGRRVIYGYDSTTQRQAVERLLAAGIPVWLFDIVPNDAGLHYAPHSIGVSEPVFSVDDLRLSRLEQVAAPLQE